MNDDDLHTAWVKRAIPQRLVVEMLHYSTWACEKTQNMKCSEILKALGVFFTEDQLSEAKAILEGKAPNAGGKRSDD